MQATSKRLLTLDFQETHSTAITYQTLCKRTLSPLAHLPYTQRSFEPLRTKAATCSSQMQARSDKVLAFLRQGDNIEASRRTLLTSTMGHLLSCDSQKTPSRGPTLDLFQNPFFITSNRYVRQGYCLNQLLIRNPFHNNSSHLQILSKLLLTKGKPLSL